ncbi:hypothetical protein DASC09_011640 [Saccharomycopsis crataegensis]|uniref:Ubiquitin-like domain-containing protein n=1 Tax=Saccharomycopsis crataegensis TaxID=43959 RepID=A0AAV5QHK1_9ASCO|nr:hypothetical protein DASC09_011640 [Saccharomycopsis crataegensis]
MMDAIVLVLRFYNVGNPELNTRTDDSENDYLFKVRKQSKFGSLSKKFASISKQDPSDLTFYKGDRFLNPSSTVNDLELQESDRILVKKLIPISVEFSNDTIPGKEWFRVLNETVSLKVEEDCTFDYFYQSLLDHLTFSKSAVASSSLQSDKVQFFKVSYKNSERKVEEILDMGAGLNKLNITANTNIIISCDLTQYAAFINKIKSLNSTSASNFTPNGMGLDPGSGKANGGGISTMITELKEKNSLLEKKIESLEKKNIVLAQKNVILDHQNSTLATENRMLSENVKNSKSNNEVSSDSLKRELDRIKSVLSEKLTQVNGLQTQKVKLANDLSSANEIVAELRKADQQKNEEIHSLKEKVQIVVAASDRIKQESHASQLNANSQLLQVKKLHNEDLLRRQEVEKKLQIAEFSFRKYAIDIYNQYGLFLTSFHSKMENLRSELHSLVTKCDIDKSIKSEINLDPIDFDYLKVISENVKVGDSFLPTEVDANTLNNLRRPKPLPQYFGNDTVMSTIFIILFEKDQQMKGMSIKEICDVWQQADIKVVAEKMSAYLTNINQRSNNIHYNLNKVWDNDKSTSVFFYDKLVDWNYIGGETTAFEKLTASSLPKSIADMRKVNVLDQLNFTQKLNKSYESLKTTSIEIDAKGINSLKNVSKNLVNVIDSLRQFKDEKNVFLKQKEAMIKKFKSELADAAKKVSFVSSYDYKLDLLASEIEALRNEKISFEKDNDIYEKFKDFGVVTVAKCAEKAPVINSKRIAAITDIDAISADDDVPIATIAATASNASFATISNDRKRCSSDVDDSPDLTKQQNTDKIPKTLIPSSDKAGIVVSNPSTNRIKERSDNKNEEPALKKAKLSNENQAGPQVNKENTIDSDKRAGSVDTDGTASDKSSDAPMNIRIDLQGAEIAPTFFKIKPTTKLKRVLKSYKTKLSSSADVTLSKDEINSIKFRIGNSLDVDYNLPVRDLGFSAMRLIVAVADLKSSQT